MLFLLSAVPAQICDAAAVEVSVARLEDQAFAAMKAATEKVALAARSGPVGAAGDAEWAEYKRLRVEADRLRADAIACRAQPVPIAAQPRETPAPVELARAYDSAAPRFRVEASGFLADRQPTSAARLGVQTRTGYAYSSTPVFQPNSIGLDDSYPRAPLRDEHRPHVRSWSSGFTLGAEFAPQGLGNRGWRFTSRIGNQLERTKSRIDPFRSDYVVTGPGQFVEVCTRCGSAYIFPVTLDVIHYSRGGATARLSTDDVSQTSKKVDVDLGAAWDFPLGGVFRGARASVGGELGAGWWTMEEREQQASVIDTFRSADGPIGRAALTGALSARVPWIDGLSWSIRSRVGYEIADITATSWDYVQYGTYSNRSIIQDMNDGVIGSLGGRLDYVRGPLGGFVAVERRRDLSLNSVVTAPGTLARASKSFNDGSALYMWPVYSSRLTVGVNYGF